MLVSRRTRCRVLLALGASVVAVAAAGAGTAAAAPVPCSVVKVKGGPPTFKCKFWPAGDGKSSGTPVLMANGARSGFLRPGANTVFCQRSGGTLGSGSAYNKNWAYVQAANGRWGWANAVHAKGGANDAPFGGGVPLACGPTVGSPPGRTAGFSVDWRFNATLYYMHSEMTRHAVSEVVNSIDDLPVLDVNRYALWYALVRPGGPWDHKPILTSMFRLSGDGFYMDVPGTGMSVYYDIWSNIHYAYVGKYAGFSTAELLTGQNIPVVSGRQSRADDAAVLLGVHLFDRYRGSALTPARIQTAIAGALNVLDELDPASVRPSK